MKGFLLQRIFGLPFDILVAVIVSLSFPRLQRYINVRTTHRTQKSLARSREEYEEVISLAAHTEFLSAELLKRLMIGLWTCLLAVFLLLASDTAISYMRSVGEGQKHGHIEAFIAVGVNVFCIAICVIATSYLQSSLRLYYGVRCIEQYVKEVPESIRDSELEGELMALRREKGLVI